MLKNNLLQLIFNLKQNTEQFNTNHAKLKYRAREPPYLNSAVITGWLQSRVQNYWK